MIIPTTNTGLQKTTSYRVVLPFYLYAALSFFVACGLLLQNTSVFHAHYFHPQTLAITHLMALGWGTMIILGASHQLLPVIIEGELSSNLLAYLSFAFAAAGIPFLVAGFYVFNMGWGLQTGGILVNLAVVCYLTNVWSSIYESKKRGVHSWIMGVASLWLFATTFFGLLLVFNFTRRLLPDNSIEYLTLHAHMGLVGWFLLLVLGVASRLIPMFLISKYTHDKTLWWLFGFVNASLGVFIAIRIFRLDPLFYYLSVMLMLVALVLFGNFCRQAYKIRIRKKVDSQMKISLLFVVLLLLPLMSLLGIIAFLPSGVPSHIVMLYGFCTFFGWLTALIFGMTFKTLPFIVWNKVYHQKAHAGKTPAPKELFSERVFNGMSIAYLAGFILFVAGILSLQDFLLKAGAFALLTSAALYIYNVGITLYHQPQNS